ncbi:MAG: prepilin-type N-terminal cleavage/methylation domain-containing protein [Elusimicrobia bacterium]|nr:prepilin-type N-terminal cleavage/methylation domain-containing protein [Elusimicrobiota bacterium]
MRKQLKRFSRGYTLLEVLIAVMVVSTATAGMMSVFLLAAKQSGTTANKTSAAFIQKRILDELKSYIVETPWAHLSADDTTFGEIHHTCTCTPACSGGTHYILEDNNGGGSTQHQAIRTDGTNMLPSTDELVTKYNATAVYLVNDITVSGFTRKQMDARVTFSEPAP